jgi:hypothetical protein
MSENIQNSELTLEQKILQELLSELVLRWNNFFSSSVGAAVPFVFDFEVRGEMVPEELQKKYAGKIIEEKDLLEMLILKKDDDWMFHHLLTREEAILVEKFSANDELTELYNNDYQLEAIKGERREKVMNEISKRAEWLIGFSGQLERLKMQQEKENDLFQEFSNKIKEFDQVNEIRKEQQESMLQKPKNTDKEELRTRLEEEIRIERIIRDIFNRLYGDLEIMHIKNGGGNDASARENSSFPQTEIIPFETREVQGYFSMIQEMEGNIVRVLKKMEEHIFKTMPSKEILLQIQKLKQGILLDMDIEQKHYIFPELDGIEKFVTEERGERLKLITFQNGNSVMREKSISDFLIKIPL